MRKSARINDYTNVIAEELQSKIVAVYYVYVCIAFLLLYHNNYIDIMQTKRALYLSGTVIMLAVAVTLSVVKMVTVQRNPVAKSKTADNGLLIVSLIMICAFSLSVIGAENKTETVLGYGAKCTGLLVYIAGLAAMIYMERYLKWNALLIWTFLFSSVAVAILQVLNRWQVDPLGMYSNLIPSEYKIFISTVGQVNYNASIDCLLLSVIMSLYLLCKQRLSQIVYGVTLVIVFAGAICCCSDSVYVGIAIIFIILFVYTLFHKELFYRLFQELILFEVAAYGIWFCWSYIQQVEFWDISALLFNMRLHHMITLAFMVFGLCGIGIMRHKFKGQKNERIAWIVYIIGCIGSAVIILKYAIQKIINPTYLQAQDLWSDYRVSIWRKCIRLFKESDIWHKLFGYGFNNVYNALETIQEGYLGTDTIQDAHNIFLNSLITSGIIGTLLWIVLLGLLISSAIRLVDKKEEALLVIAGVAAYVAQGMVNGPQILSTPFFLMLLGLYWSIIREDEKKESSGT